MVAERGSTVQARSRCFAAASHRPRLCSASAAVVSRSALSGAIFRPGLEGDERPGVVGAHLAVIAAQRQLRFGPVRCQGDGPLGGAPAASALVGFGVTLK